MGNNYLFMQATEIAESRLKEDGIFESEQEIDRRVIKWYNNTHVEDAETLAALAISGDYEYPLVKAEIDEIRSFYFTKDGEN